MCLSCIGGTTFETRAGFLAGKLVTIARSLLDVSTHPWIEHEGERYLLGPVNCVFRSTWALVPTTWAPVPEDLGAESERSDDRRWSGGGGVRNVAGSEAFLPPHGLAAEREDVSVVYEAIADRVGNSRV